MKSNTLRDGREKVREAVALAIRRLVRGGSTPVQLAARFGVSPITIERWATDTHPPYTRASHLAPSLGIDPVTGRAS